nr:uncharacterized protein LOC106681285 isoform X2 [Halyomorpha halys]
MLTAGLDLGFPEQAVNIEGINVFMAEDFNRELFNNIMIRKSLSKENYISTYLATRREIKPNPCNFFTLDFYLLTSMVAGTVTYVTLLVQFTLLK